MTQEISQRQARAHILAKHGLISPFDSAENCLSRLVAIQTQYAQSLPVALAVRVKKFKAGSELGAMQSGQVVKGWTLRNTLHAHNQESHQLLIESFLEVRKRRALRFFEREVGWNDKKIWDVVDLTLAALENCPLTRPQLHEKVPELREIPYAGWGCDVMLPSHLGELILLTPEKGASQFKRHKIQVQRSPEEAQTELLHRYMQGYGPATLQDFCYWSGLPNAVCKEALVRNKPRLKEVNIEGKPGTHFIPVDEEFAAKTSVPSTLFLAKFDVLTLGYKDKSLFLAPKFHPQVYRKAGQIEAIILKRGKAVATWRLDAKSKSAAIKVEPFEGSKSDLEVACKKPLKGLSASLGLDLAWQQQD